MGMVAALTAKIHEKWHTLRQAFLAMDEDKSGTLTAQVSAPIALL